MMQVIIYKNDENNVAIIYPTDRDLQIYGIDAIARKDVPHGKHYKIVNIEDLPLDGTLNMHGIPNIDKSFRNQWDVDEADLTDGIGAESNEFDEVSE